MKKYMSGISFRLALLRDNDIEQLDIVKALGINGAKVSLEIHGKGYIVDTNRKLIYRYYQAHVVRPVSYKMFWSKMIEIKVLSCQ